MTSPLQKSVEEVDAADFTEAMSNVCAPVTIITTVTPDGEAYGTTVSAFASLSLTPPMVTISLDKKSVLLEHVRKHGRVGVNILSSDQSELAKNFARSRTDKFEGVEWRLADGLPKIEGCTSWLVCRVDDTVPGGDHVLLLAQVQGIHNSTRTPLVYARRSFGFHSALPAPAKSEKEYCPSRD